MIALYSGTPGSGKSAHGTRLIDLALKKGVGIICNYPLVLDMKRHKGRFTYIDTFDLNPKYFYEYAKKYHKERKEGQTIVVIDEASILFNSRSAGDKLRMEWLRFFSTHRHYGFDIILITQRDRALDRQIREMIEIEHEHRKLIYYGLKGIFVILLTRKQFVSVKKWYPIKEKIGVEYFNISKRHKKMYNTFANFNDEEESKSNDWKNEKTN